jgi:hypothetical protein
MPRVTLEFELPTEKVALEDALMGAEALAALEALRSWMAPEVAARGAALHGSASYEFRRGVEACNAQLQEILALGREDGEPVISERDGVGGAG